MSRLRRLVLSNRFFFLSCRVLPTRQNLSEFEFAILAQVLLERRRQHGFLLTAWVFVFEPGRGGPGAAAGRLEMVERARLHGNRTGAGRSGQPHPSGPHLPARRPAHQNMKAEERIEVQNPPSAGSEEKPRSL